MKTFEAQRMKKGFEVLKKMGREQTMFNQKELYPDLYDLSVGYLFGEIWSRLDLADPTRVRAVTEALWLEFPDEWAAARGAARRRVGAAPAPGI